VTSVTDAPLTGMFWASTTRPVTIAVCAATFHAVVSMVTATSAAIRKRFLEKCALEGIGRIVPGPSRPRRLKSS